MPPKNLDNIIIVEGIADKGLFECELRAHFNI